MDRYRWIVSAAVDVLECNSLTLSVFEEINPTLWMNFEIFQRVADFIFVLVVEMTLEFDEWAILVGVWHVFPTILLGQDNQETESIALTISRAVMLAMRLVKLCSFS